MDIRFFLLPAAVLLIALCVVLPAGPTAKSVMGWAGAVLAGMDVLLRLTDL